MPNLQALGRFRRAPRSLLERRRVTVTVTLGRLAKTAEGTVTNAQNVMQIRVSAAGSDAILASRADLIETPINPKRLKK